MSADILPFFSKNTKRMRPLLEEDLKVLAALALDKIGTPVGRADLVMRTGYEEVRVARICAKMEANALVIGCADPINHYRLNHKGFAASYNGGVILERTDCMLKHLPKIGEA